MDDKLQYIISSFFDDKGFQGLEGAVGKTKKQAGALSQMMNSSLGRMAAGYMTVSTLANQYNKMVEASNYQLEQETKLYSTMKGQGFHDEQIESIKAYAGALQEVGVVGDEVTLAGAQQLATFNLTEESLKRLMPAMQDIIVQQKGLKGTGQDAVSAANMLAKGLLGQTGMLEKAGITLTDYQKNLISTGKQEEKVGALVEAVTMNVGKQNAEFLKTPEGKIVSAQNRIGDLYEFWGMQIRETRASIWETMGENSESIKQFVSKALKIGSGFVDTFVRSIHTVQRGFDSLSDNSKKSLGIVAMGALAAYKPIIGIALAAEDIFAAFQGKESFTEDGINALLDFTGTDYKFQDLRKDIDDFFLALTNPAKEAEQELSFLNATLQGTVELLESGVNIAKVAFGVSQIGGAIGQFGNDLWNEDFDTAKENFSNSLSVQTIKEGWTGFEGNAQAMVDIGKRRQETVQNEEEKQLREKLEVIVNNPSIPQQINNWNNNDGRVPVNANFAPSGNEKTPVNNNVTIHNNITVQESKDGKKAAEEIQKLAWDSFMDKAKLGGVYGSI